MIVAANEVKTRGVSLFDKLFKKFNEVIINVRGKNKYCVIPFEEYEEYRIYKLEKAYKEVVDDLNNNNFHSDTSRHLKEIEETLKNV